MTRSRGRRTWSRCHAFVGELLRLCVAELQVYLKTCRTQHGAATLSCKPKTGHHTKGLATACISKKCASPLGLDRALACPLPG